MPEPGKGGLAEVQRVIWKWFWRFCLAAVALTLLLSLLVGALLRHAVAHLPPWLGGVLALAAVVMVGGGMLPAIQRDLARAREERE